MRAIVLGGSGFIGGHLAQRLKAQGYDVLIADVKKPAGFQWSEWVKVSILDEELDKIVEDYKPDVIFECSGVLGTAETFEHIPLAVDVNIRGVLNALNIATKYNIALIYVGLTNKWFNPYTITKQAANKFCQMYFKEFGTKVVVIKGLNAYGPRQHWKQVRKIAPTFITRALENEPILINGTGNQVVDMVHTDDLAEIMIRAFEKGIWGESIDGGTGIPMTVNEVAEKVIKMVGSSSEIVYQPMRRGEPEISVTLANPAPVRQLLDFYPEVSFEDGMKSTIEWYRENYKTFE